MAGMEAARASSEFRTSSTDVNGLKGVAVSGELDYATCDRLSVALQEASDHDRESVLLDLGECTFVDSMGVGVIVEAATRLSASGRKLVVCNVHGQVRKMLRLTGLVVLDGLLVYSDCPSDG
jgi:anti-sigma B factor antagonist